MTTTTLKAPFPYPGGKSRVAQVVWDALGDVDNYVEPFAGSLAVLLGRPPTRKARAAETVSDLNGYIANFWRALQADPDGVARYADYPVSHVDQYARHWWLVDQRQDLIDLLASDPDAYDLKIAGWWVWGISTWIGSGWCDPSAVSKPAPIGDPLDVAGIGVKAKRPHLRDAGQGVNAERGDNLGNYMRCLSARLKDVRIIHGDWSRLTRGALKYGARKGAFLDPPYDQEKLATRTDLYSGHHDSSISASVREWALSVGNDPAYRIVLAGFEQEHEEHMPASWRRFAWSSTGMQATKTSDSNQTRHYERLWMSPHCQTNTTQLSLLGEER